MYYKKSERGQALIIIVFAIIGLIGMTGLTVDGGRTFVDRQSAQSSADSAAIGAALAKAKNGTLSLSALTAIANNIAATNGYVNNTTHDTITVTNPPGLGCNNETSVYAGNSQYIHVKIVTNVKAYFAPVIGVSQTHNCVEATARAITSAVVPLFDGNAVVGLNPSASNCAFDSGSSSSVEWKLTGGGLLSNGCATSKNSASVSIPTNKCVSAVSGVTGGLVGKTCATAPVVYTPEEIEEMTPRNPCTGTPSGGVYPGGGKVVTAGQITFANGVYCMDTEAKMNALSGKVVNLINATLYVTATQFDVKFSGGGYVGTGFSGFAPTSGDYAGYYMVVADNGYPCTTYTGNGTNKQVLEYEGNGTSDIIGTIFAPSACIDYRGNANAKKTESQVIGYTVTSNGTALVEINYDQTKNGQRTIVAKVELIK